MIRRSPALPGQDTTKNLADGDPAPTWSCHMDSLAFTRVLPATRSAPALPAAASKPHANSATSRAPCPPTTREGECARWGLRCRAAVTGRTVARCPDMGADGKVSLDELLEVAVDTRLVFLSGDEARAILILLAPLEAESSSQEVRQAAAEVRHRITSRLDRPNRPART